MRELRLEAAAERETLTAEILASLGRPASAIDRIAAANLAARHIRANRIEASGRDASAVRQQITQAVRATGFRPQPAAKQAESVDDYLSRTAGGAR
jgi:phosphotransferase system HPr-like phosphotransfer protein